MAVGDAIDAPARLMLISHGGDLYSGGEIAFDELVHGFRRFHPSSALLVVAPANSVIVQRARTAGAQVAVVPQPRWGDYGRYNTSDWLRTLPSAMRSLVQMVGLIRAWRPDVVLASTLTIPVGPIAARMCRTQLVWLIQEFGQHDHGLSFALGYRRTVQAIGRLADAVDCCSEAVCETMRTNGVPARKLFVAYGVDTAAETRSRQRRSGDPLVVIVVGRLAEAKGQLFAVRAVGQAVRGGADIHLRLVGPTHEERYRAELEEAAREEGIAERVHFVGNLDDPRDEYRNADVFLMCSRAEAFGRVTVEAMRMALPVIGFSSGGTPEFIEPDRTGYLVSPGDVRTMADRLTDCWRDEELCRRLGAAGQRTSMHRFSTEAWIRGILTAITS